MTRSWLAVFVILVAGVALLGTHFSDSNQLPASDSSTAYSLLAKAGSHSASAKTGTIVWHTASGSAVAGSTRASMNAMLDKVSRVDGVASVVSPFVAGNQAQISKNRRTAYATVIFASDTHKDDAKQIARNASRSSVKVLTGGTEFTNQTPSESTEVVGVIAALLVLLLVLRSWRAAVLPIVTGVAGVAVASMAVLLLSHVLSLSSVSLSLGALIGLGVGIDYALLIVNRHIRALRAGDTVPEAIARSLNTSGRSVLFAGATVVVALLGMLILGFGFLTGMAIGAALTVTITVAAAVTLLPAWLAMVGPKVLRRAERDEYAPGQRIDTDTPAAASGGVFARWAGCVQRRPVPTSIAALAILVLLASPVMSLRLGSADASSDPTGSSTRQFYDTMAQSFGKGYQADLLLVAQTPNAGARQAFIKLVRQLPQVADVATVAPPRAVGSSGLTVVTVQPKTAAQDEATATLVHTLRDRLITHAEVGNDLRVHVGGTTATSIDFANALANKLPVYLGIIAVLGFLLLTLAFRSLLVPLIGATSNLLTIGVALGATVAVFQWGWGPAQFGVGGQAPVEYIVAMLIIGVIFGLSMDYQVFLASHIREEWVHTHDNAQAIKAGVTHTGRVIATAAAIMFCVFMSFGFSGMRTASEFGVGLAIAVLADAFLVRMTIIPAVMKACGSHNWAIPAWLDRALPNLSVEGPADESDPSPRLAGPVSELVASR